MTTNSITGTTRLTGLLGSPVAHSISPSMHNEAFKTLNLDYVYLAFDVGTNNLKTAVEGLKALNIRGFNLTMPDKHLIIDLVDKLTPAARLANSVNTVINDDGILTGHTTDGIGYMQAVKDAGYNIIDKKMTVLGAGGAATAICVQAALDGVSEISIFKRRNSNYNDVVEFAANVSNETNCKITVNDFDDEGALKENVSESAIIVNTTPVGMAPNSDECAINEDLFKDRHIFHRDLIVSDIIYNPKVTKFMQHAIDNNLNTFNGLYMLLYQGAASFKCWSGFDMPIQLIKDKYFS